MQRKCIALCVAAVCCLAVSAAPKDLRFVDGENLTLINKTIETPDRYTRVDTTQYDGFTNYQRRELTQHSCGLALCFKTNSSSVYARPTYRLHKKLATQTGVNSEGFCLYIKKNGKWKYAGANTVGKDGNAASPWKDRIEVELQDIGHFTSEALFDVIVSNPPYFADSLKCPDGQRNIARHTDSLDFDKLAESAARLLHPEGAFSVIIPTDGKEFFLRAATRYGLHLSHQTLIHTTPGADPKRVLLAFKFSVGQCVTDNLTIELSRHVYSEEYIALTKDFYLRM